MILNPQQISHCGATTPLSGICAIQGPCRHQNAMFAPPSAILSFSNRNSPPELGHFTPKYGTIDFPCYASR